MNRVGNLSLNAAIRYGLLIVIGVFLIYPLLWMIGSSFKENIDISARWRFCRPKGAEHWKISNRPGRSKATTFCRIILGTR